MWWSFTSSPSGVSLAGREGLWLPYPVEYKKGSDQTKESDEVQLCGQALCLEEMLCCQIPEGSLFYGETRRRTSEWLLTGRSGSERLSCFTSCWGTWMRGYTPGAKLHKGCNACSLTGYLPAETTAALRPSPITFMPEQGRKKPCENS